MKNFICQESIEKVISIILRLPGLFLLDFYYTLATTEDATEDPPGISGFAQILVAVHCLLFLILPLENLVSMYMHYISAALIFMADVYTSRYVEKESTESFLKLTNNDTALNSLSFLDDCANHLEAVALQVAVATTVCCFLDLGHGMAWRLPLAAYTLPVVARFAGAPTQYLQLLHQCASAIIILWTVCYAIVMIPFLMAQLKIVYQTFIRTGYVMDLPLVLWDKHHIMPQLLVFWFVMLFFQLYKYWHQLMLKPSVMTTVPIEQWYILLLYTVSEVCSSPFSLAASCVAVTYTARMLLFLTCVIAQGRVSHAGDSNRTGVGAGVTMALLALQTGLAHLPMPQRAGAMSIVLFIVLGSLVQSMHEEVQPMLMQLCASQRTSVIRHARILTICLFLLVLPLYMTVFLCSLFKVDFWTLVIVSTFTLTSVQVLGALTVYVLFMYDSLCKDSEWEVLDDVVYYARAVTRVLEFLVAVLVVGAGLHESVVLSNEGHPWSWLNSSVLLVHCYYNVYLRLQAGWNSFLLRREAARRIHSLPCASESQLASRAHDVCPVCYSPMQSACVTPCSHLFHASCLRKWLYVQDRCPLCSAQIVVMENSNLETNNAVPSPPEETKSSHSKSEGENSKTSFSEVNGRDQTQLCNSTSCSANTSRTSETNFASGIKCKLSSEENYEDQRLPHEKHNLNLLSQNYTNTNFETMKTTFSCDIANHNGESRSFHPKDFSTS